MSAKAFCLTAALLTNFIYLLSADVIPDSPKRITESLFHKGWYDRLHPNSFSKPVGELLPLLSPKLKNLVRKWYDLRENLYSTGPSPEGNYDPIVQSLWVVTSVKFSDEKISDQKSSVLVFLKRSSEQGYIGYESDVCHFLLLNQKWLLDEIYFDRTIVNTYDHSKTKTSIVLSKQLEADIFRFQKILLERKNLHAR